MVSARLRLLALVLSSALAARVGPGAPGGPEAVVVQSGALKLSALLWRPEGRGPFPAVLFNHGSGHAAGTAAARGDHRQPERLGPVFARHGYVFLYLFRRGDGLSGGQGTASGNLMDRALARQGQEARNQIQIRLLEDDEMGDALAGIAFLRAIPDVDVRRIAVAGHSFGGALTLLAAERDSSLRAAVVLSAAGYAWERSPQLRSRLLAAVDHLTMPVFLIHAANDYSVAAGNALGAEMARLGKPYRLMIYPAVGRTLAEGHDFVHLKVAVWEPDVFTFLDEHTKP